MRDISTRPPRLPSKHIYHVTASHLVPVCVYYRVGGYLVSKKVHKSYIIVMIFTTTLFCIKNTIYYLLVLRTAIYILVLIPLLFYTTTISTTPLLLLNTTMDTNT